LLRPDPKTNNAFIYCLAEAAQRCAISVLLPCALLNHYHAVIFDELGTYPQFIEHFNKIFARSQNAGGLPSSSNVCAPWRRRSLPSASGRDLVTRMRAH